MIEKVKSGVIAYLNGGINQIQIVLMGGGAYLPETEKEFNDKFRCDIIIGENKLKSGGNLFGTAYGLLRFGIDDRKTVSNDKSKGLAKKAADVFHRLTSWATVKLS